MRTAPSLPLSVPFSGAWRLPLLALGAALTLSGCGSLLTPEYQRPAAPIPQAWPTCPAYAGAPQGDKGPAAVELGWRDFILDRRLAALVEQALAQNRDLRISALNIEKARAQYGIARADLFPSVNGAASGTHARTAQDLTPADTARTTHVYGASLGFSAYELDFFGRIRNLKDAALQRYLNTVEARNSQQITLIAEVASAYLTLAADQARLTLAQATERSQGETLDLIRRRFALGVGSQLDVSGAQTSVETARADVAAYTSAVAQDMNALTLLVGGPVAGELLPGGELLDGAPVLQDVPAGVSSQVLLRRPDLVADEHMLRAYDANIGAARAAFFPSITLTAGVGTGSDEMSRLFLGRNGTWNFVPQINLPIFRGGALTSALASAKADREIGVAQYEKDIQTAFKEVADALAQRGTLGEQLQALQANESAAALSFKLYGARYNTGISSYMDLLVSQRSLYGAQQNLITAKLNRQTNLVTLYKVLGGGVRERTGEASGG